MNKRRRKSLFLLAVATAIFVSIPGYGTVIVSCHDIGGGVAEMRYDASEESVLVRAFALDITVDGEATIESVFDYKIGLSTEAEPGYGYFPGTIEFGDNGEVIDWGTPVAPSDDPGALPGLGTYGVTLEMGSLYEGPENAPLASGTLVRFAVDLHGESRINVDLSLNVLRGGIVMEDGRVADVDLIGCMLVPEPGTVLLLGLGGLAVLRGKRGWLISIG